MSSETKFIVPDFLNDEFFKSVLIKHTKNDTVKIVNMEIRPGSNTGEQFMSSMFKVKIVYTTNEKFEVNWIVKVKPIDDGSAAKFLKEYPRAFETEIAMYNEVVPRIRQILEKNNILWKLAPDMIYEGNDPTQILILEDVSLDRFRPIVTPLDLEDTKKLTKNLAIFHAASLFLDSSKYKSKIYYERGADPHNPAHSIIIPTCELYVKFFEEKSNEQYSEIIKMLQELRTTFPKELTRIYASQRVPLYEVLNHGDYSVRNVLYDNEKGMFQNSLMVRKILNSQFNFFLNTCLAD